MTTTPEVCPYGHVQTKLGRTYCGLCGEPMGNNRNNNHSTPPASSRPLSDNTGGNGYMPQAQPPPLKRWKVANPRLANGWSRYYSEQELREQIRNQAIAPETLMWSEIEGEKPANEFSEFRGAFRSTPPRHQNTTGTVAQPQVVLSREELQRMLEEATNQGAASHQNGSSPLQNNGSSSNQGSTTYRVQGQNGRYTRESIEQMVDDGTVTVDTGVWTENFGKNPRKAGEEFPQFFIFLSAPRSSSNFSASQATPPAPYPKKGFGAQMAWLNKHGDHWTTDDPPQNSFRKETTMLTATGAFFTSLWNNPFLWFTITILVILTIVMIIPFTGRGLRHFFTTNVGKTLATLLILVALFFTIIPAVAGAYTATHSDANTGATPTATATTQAATPTVAPPPTAPPATGSGNCQAQQLASHDPNSGDWSLDPGDGYIVAHVWTNNPPAGFDQRERILEIGPNTPVTLHMGGRAWQYPSTCKATADLAYSRDSAAFSTPTFSAGTTLDALRSLGLVA